MRMRVQERAPVTVPAMKVQAKTKTVPGTEDQVIFPRDAPAKDRS